MIKSCGMPCSLKTTYDVGSLLIRVDIMLATTATLAALNVLRSLRTILKLGKSDDSIKFRNLFAGSFKVII